MTVASSNTLLTCTCNKTGYQWHCIWDMVLRCKYIAISWLEHWIADDSIKKL